MRLKRFLATFTTILLISACSTPVAPTPQVITTPKNIYPYTQIQPHPRAVNLSNVSWKVVTKANIDEFLKNSVIPGSDNFVFIAVTVKDYEKMSLNIDELRRYINQQGELIVYYENSAEIINRKSGVIPAPVASPESFYKPFLTKPYFTGGMHM